MAAVKTRKKKSALRDNVEALVYSALLYLIVSHFVMQAFRIPSESMRDTLLVGDYLFANKFLYGAEIPFTHGRLPAVRAPRRGDIIVFDFPPDPSKQFIKRCIATGGDTVVVRHKQVYVNGVKLVEPYVKHILGSAEDSVSVSPRDNFGPYTVPRGSLFMMGDNRDNSLDSRYWGFVPRENIIGKPLVIFWSYDAPTEDWVGNTGNHYTDLAKNFFVKTCWERTLKLVRGSPSE